MSKLVLCFLSYSFFALFFSNHAIAKTKYDLLDPVQNYQDLKKLEKSLGTRLEDRKTLQDIILIMEALSHEEKGEQALAQKKWFAALKVAPPDTGQIALHGWAKSLGIPKKKEDLQDFYKRVWQFSRRGEKFPFFKHKKIFSQNKLKKYLAKNLIGKHIIDLSHQLSPLETSEDPFLLKNAKRFSELEDKIPTVWQKWKRDLDPNLNKYWHALVFYFRGEHQEAIRSFKGALTYMSSKKDLLPYQQVALRTLARLLRHNGGRAEAVSQYLKLVDLWRNTSFDAPLSIHKQKHDWLLERVNDFNWAARSLAFVNRNKEAQALIQENRGYLKRWKKEALKFKRKARKKLTLYEAEMAYILGVRIHRQTKEYQKAKTELQEALTLRGLPRKWYENLRWHLGLTHYLAADQRRAIVVWQRLNRTTKSEKILAKTNYWLYRCHKKEDNEKLARHYMKNIIEKSPIDYYKLVALGIPYKITGLTPPSLTNQQEINHSKKSQRLNPLSAFEKIERFSKWHKRIELLIQLGLDKWAKRSARLFYKEAKNNLLFARNQEAFVYLSRLLHRTKNYQLSISLTYELQKQFKDFWKKWPDQLMYYFPRPYENLYQKSATKADIDADLLYAISRQESLFDPDALSPANAIGLMQVIPPTAKKVINTHKIKHNKKLERQLQEPDFNAHIGALYVSSLLKRYKGVKPYVLGNYNAGPEALQKWLETFPNKDMALWVELVSFSETREYIKKVWRNLLIYQELSRYQKMVALGKQKQPQ